MQMSCTGLDCKRLRIRKLIPSLVLPGLAALQVLGIGVDPVVAQAPESGTINTANNADLDPAIEAEWKRLRETVGTQEISAPQETIRRYQQFYEQRGARSLITAIKINRLIAQIYWQELNNREKALEIYDWTLKTYGDLPHTGTLKTERDLVANTPSLQSLISVAPLSVSRSGKENAVPAPLIIKVPVPGTSALPQNIRIAPGAGFSPVSNMPSAIPLPGGVAKNPFSVAPLTATGIPQAPTTSHTLERSALAINPRLTALTGYITQWQEGQLSWEQMLKTANFTEDDIILLTSQHGVVSMGNGGGVLRARLGDFIRQSSRLVEHWETLPVPAQVALAEHYTRSKDPQAVKIYHHLLNQKVPAGAWWTKELLMYRFSEYYAAQGDYVKAAEVNEEIASVSKHPDWKSDSRIVAARYYRQAGQDAKASELYKRAEVGARAWALGILRYDQARILIAQGKHEEARKLLMLPLEGSLSEQVQIVVWALLGYSYYRTGDDTLARKYSQEAVDQSQRFIQLVANEGLEQQVVFAQRTLQEINRWSETPLLAQSASVHLTIPTDYQSGNPFGFTLGVQSRYRVPLEVKCALASVRMRAVPPEKAVDHGHYFQTTIIAELDSNAVLQLKQGDKRMQFDINVTSVKYPDLKLKIPVIITADEAK